MISFISGCFSGRVNLRQIEKKTALGVRGHALLKNFKTLHFYSAYKNQIVQFLIRHIEIKSLLFKNRNIVSLSAEIALINQSKRLRLVLRVSTAIE